MRYMLDTNVCISLIKHRPVGVKNRLIQFAPDEIGVSGIVAAELWFGVANSQKKKQNSEALTDFLTYAVLLDWPHEAAPLYGKIRTGLQKRGTPIGAMDLLIATHALFLEAVLVTNNTREFERVPGLKIENWEKMGDG
ncbi:MAG: type II toxin-antitoxin system VapC family toxin [Pseudomonadota bacterium]